MEDETVLDLTRKKLKLFEWQFLKRQSLERCAVRLIEENIGFYLNAQDKEQQLKSLPGAVRDKILQELLKRKCRDENGNGEEFELLTKAFNLLLSPRTRSLELNGILSFCPDRYKDESIREVTPHCVLLLEEISKVATNLKELTLRSNHAFRMHIRPERIDPQMILSLAKLKHLNRLFIELYYFEVHEILDLCKSIPNLQYVNVRLEHLEKSEYPSAKSLKASLSNLKEFMFESKDPHDDHNWLRELCIRNLPNLEAVQFYSDVNDVLKNRGCWINSEISLEFAAKLKHVYTDGRKSSLDSLIHLFANVTHLSISSYGIAETAENETDYDFCALYKSEKLKCLNMNHFKWFPEPIFERLCSTYGSKLHTLCISNDTVSYLELEIIITHCKALEKLALQNICFSAYGMPTADALIHNCQLKELEWKFTDVEALPDVNDEPFMDLSFILSAPKLEKVELRGIVFDLDDLTEVSAMIERRQILQNLHTLNFDFCWLEEEPEDAEIFKAVANVVKSASARLPNLRNVKFASSYRDEFWARYAWYNPMFDDFKAYVYKYHFKDPFLTYEKMNKEQLLEDDCILKILDLYDSQF